MRNLSFPNAFERFSYTLKTIHSNSRAPKSFTHYLLFHSRGPYCLGKMFNTYVGEWMELSENRYNEHLFRSDNSAGYVMV